MKQEKNVVDRLSIFEIIKKDGKYRIIYGLDSIRGIISPGVIEIEDRVEIKIKSSFEEFFVTKKLVEVLDIVTTAIAGDGYKGVGNCFIKISAEGVYTNCSYNNMRTMETKFITLEVDSLYDKLNELQ